MGKLLILTALFLTACSTIQTRYVGPNGQYGSGTISGGVMSMNNGKFSIAADGVTCSGNFPSWEKLTVVFPVWCTDGNNGTVTMTRPPVNVISGEGNMQLTNGDTRHFTFS